VIHGITSRSPASEVTDRAALTRSGDPSATFAEKLLELVIVFDEKLVERVLWRFSALGRFENCPVWSTSSLLFELPHKRSSMTRTARRTNSSFAKAFVWSRLIG